MEKTNAAGEQKNVLLSIQDLVVKFRVRGRILTAIRGISLDIYENESIAIVGESGSGKSVFTKTFAGMLDDNGFIDHGDIIFNDEELADTCVSKGRRERFFVGLAKRKLDQAASLEYGAATWQALEELEHDKKMRMTLDDATDAEYRKKIDEAVFRRTEAYNRKLTYASSEKEKIRAANAEIKKENETIAALNRERAAAVKAHKKKTAGDRNYLSEYRKKKAELTERYRKEISKAPTPETKERNLLLAKEIYLSVGRYGARKRFQLTFGLLRAFRKAMRMGVDVSDEQQRNAVFDTVAFRVRYLDEDERRLHGTCVLNLGKIRYEGDWGQIRGRRIATVFQDPMTSLNPIIPIGKQITSIILKHQHCSESEARARALILMKKVGIPNAEKRFDDYPFQYSGGMRQRIVIAIALSCQPKILICDEPTTALDVTIQAQILQLIKDLQKEFGYTIVFITHDLGVVANIADRVAVLYAGQIVELGKVDEVFYDPRHPYTWALLSSLPQLAERNTKLYSITGTPPSLYNEIIGDPFAPRNPYCMKLDTLMEPPMFRVTETHYAKTWLLDPRAPKVEKPEIIRNIHERLMRAFNI